MSYYELVETLRRREKQLEYWKDVRRQSRSDHEFAKYSDTILNFEEEIEELREKIRKYGRDENPRLRSPRSRNPNSTPRLGRNAHPMHQFYVIFWEPKTQEATLYYMSNSLERAADLFDEACEDARLHRGMDVSLIKTVEGKETVLEWHHNPRP